LQGLPADGTGKKYRTRARRERLERRTDIVIGRIIAGDEERFDRPRFPEHPLQHQHQRHEIPSSNPAMHQRGDPGTVAHRIEPTDERRRARPHHGQQRVDRLDHAGYAAKCQRRSAETNDLPVFVRRIAANDVNRVESRVAMVEGLIQILERPTQCFRTLPSRACLSPIPDP
jgi:hypothetical protein